MAILKFKYAASLAVIVLITACSSSDKESGNFVSVVKETENVTVDPTVEPLWQKGVFKPRAEYENYCANPRQGDDYLDMQATAMHEKMWLRSMSQELYLWNDQLEDIDPSDYSIEAYFGLLKVPYPQDRFHWSQASEEYEQASHSGVYFGYGVTWTIVDGTHSLGVQSVAVDAGLPSNIKRGDIFLGFDDIYLEDVRTDEKFFPDIFWDALYPQTLGEEHTFILQDRDTAEQKRVILAAADIALKSVPISKVLETDAGKVAYVQFDRHNTVAEGELIKAFGDLENENVSDLVLDLRYNVGGYIAIASELAYMIAGAANTSGEPFTQYKVNDALDGQDPFTGNPIEPEPFYQVNTESEPLPTLNLNRVFVLTSAETCSASELIMNGLAGVDVEVIQIGGATCGKPYGFYPMQNCGTTYFTIMVSNENAKGFGDFFNGFSPSEFDYSAPDVFQGCVVDDDFGHDLGTVDEAMLSTALAFQAFGECPQLDSASPSMRTSAESSRLRTLMRERSTQPF